MNLEKELTAMRLIGEALEPLSPRARKRVLAFVLDHLDEYEDQRARAELVKLATKEAAPVTS